MRVYGNILHFVDNITHYKTESVHFRGLMNSATKICRLCELSDHQSCFLFFSRRTATSAKTFPGSRRYLLTLFGYYYPNI